MSSAQQINFRSSNHNKSRFSLPLKIVCAIVLILAIFYVFFPNALPTFFTYLARPFFVGQESALEKENSDLKNTLADDQAQILESTLIQKENDELKGLLGRGSSTHFVLGEVLKKPPYSAYDTFVLDVGSSNGIVIGDRVYAAGTIPIGDISEVTSDTSKVLLYSSSGEHYAVLVGSSTIPAVAIGQGGGAFSASVPRDSDVAVGDTVTIPTLNHSFLGTVQDVISDPSHPFSTVLFNQPFNMYEVQWVQVDIDHQ